MMNHTFHCGKRRFAATMAVFIFCLLLINPGKRLTQQIPVTPATSQPTDTEIIPTDGLFFADIIVRGQPIFQIGSVGDVNATQRAQIVNRRIAGILAQPQGSRNVTVVPDQSRGIATLQVGNRVLLTVTQQDAQDFNLPVETLAQQWANQLSLPFLEMTSQVAQAIKEALMQAGIDMLTDIYTVKLLGLPPFIDNHRVKDEK